MGQFHPGQDNPHPDAFVPGLAGEYPEFLDHVVGQEFFGDLGDMGFGEVLTGQEEELGGIDRGPIRQRPPQVGRDGFPGHVPGRVPHPGLEAHPDGPVEIPGQGLETGYLGSGVGEDVGADRLQVCRGQVQIQHEDPQHPDGREVEAEIFPGLAAHPFAFCVREVRAPTDFQPHCHSSPQNFSGLMQKIYHRASRIERARCRAPDLCRQGDANHGSSFCLCYSVFIRKIFGFLPL